MCTLGPIYYLLWSPVINALSVRFSFCGVVLRGTVNNRTCGTHKNLYIYLFLLLLGTIVNRTCGAHKNLYVSLFLLVIFGPVNYDPP